MGVWVRMLTKVRVASALGPPNWEVGGVLSEDPEGRPTLLSQEWGPLGWEQLLVEVDSEVCGEGKGRRQMQM
jgi:hypothetical protein